MLNLIRNIHSSPLKKTIVSAFADVCRRLSVEIIAEGVETIAEVDALHRMGINLMQGYFFAHPQTGQMPEVNFPSEISKHSVGERMAANLKVRSRVVADVRFGSNGSGYSPSMMRWMRWARPVAPSQEMRAAHIFGLPLAGSNLPGIPVRKRARTSSVSTPMTES